MSGVAVRCIGLVHVYRVSGTDTAALRGVDLTVRPSERISLFGPSGSGKSTLLTLLAGIRQPSAGQIIVDDADIGRAPEKTLRAYRRTTVGVLLQDPTANLLTYATPIDNVRYAQGFAREAAHTDPRNLLDAAGLGRRERRTPVDRLSRAGQQAAALATALANSPRLLLADEPTSELAPAESRRLVANLLDLAAGTGTTVIIVTHDRVVAEATDRTLLMRDGLIGAEHSGDDAQRPLSVVTADGSLQLPDTTFGRWPAGTRVEIDETDEQTLTVRRVTGREELP
jgi:putative ABC transport system ATP-binding protein